MDAKHTNEHCMCDACKDGVIHASDCAVHNMPAYPNGPCSCTPRVSFDGTADLAHTPGPWEWDGPVWSYDSDNEAPWLIQSESDHRVFVLMGSIRCNNKADARLIAAAPDLLHALKALLAETTGPEEVWAEGSAVEHARAAIAKATGE